MKRVAHIFTYANTSFADIAGVRYVELAAVIPYLPAELAVATTYTRSPRSRAGKYQPTPDYSLKNLVLTRIAAGMTNSEIAKALDIRADRIRFYRAHFRSELAAGTVSTEILGPAALEVFYADADAGMSTEQLATEYGLSVTIANNLLARRSSAYDPLEDELRNDEALQNLTRW